MKIEIIKTYVENLCLTHLKDLSLNRIEWNVPGKSPYNLCAYMSTFFNRTIIIDIGTGVGGSALALSYNPTNRILSYDGFYQGADRINQPNIEWRIDNVVEDMSFDWDAVSIVNLDVDSEDGSIEKDIIEFLRGKKWSGILLIDKIYKKNLYKLWNDLHYEKFDVTKIGSKKGTGIVNFGQIKKHEIIIDQ
jgi:hypothetical protein